MSNRCAPRPPFGFTLVELLIVVAIIGLLIAILLPALGRARSTAKRTSCLAKTRELVAGWGHLLSDQGERIKLGQYQHWTFGGQQGVYFPVQFMWERPLNRYLGLEPIIGRFDPPTARVERNRVADSGVEVFRCPADRGGHESNDAPYVSFFGTSYFSNWLLVTSTVIEYPEPYRGRSAPSTSVAALLTSHAAELT